MARALGTAAVGLTAFVVYLLTLFPGLGGGGDSAKFQYLGSVLGTAHPPGYPLYVWISYLFSQLPIGSLAYRINLMSAFFGALAVVFVYLTLVRLRCHAGVAAAAALGLAFGRFFWERSLVAEVYSLNAALVALIVFLAVRWSESKRDRDLYFAIAACAISLGNHLSVAALAPALVLYVWLVHPPSINLRNVAVGAVIVAAGLAQYLFIIVRTLQQAPHVEASATNLRELFDVLRATRYADQQFAFTLGEFLAERLPRFWRVLWVELGVGGLAALALGLAVTAGRRLPGGVLAVAGATSLALLALNVNADVEGFLVAAFVPVWILAGLGMQGLWSVAARAGRAAGPAALAACLVVPVVAVWRYWPYNDHHNRTFETQYFHALFDRLEAKSAIVSEAYPIDQSVMYMLVGERAARGRAIVIVPNEADAIERLAAQGYAVYAFSEAAASLEPRGFAFETVAVGGSGTGMTIHRLASRASCAEVGNLGWRDISSLAAAGEVVWRIDNYRAFDSVAVMYVAAPGTGPAELVIAQGPIRPSITSTPFNVGIGAERARLQAALASDQVPDAGAFLTATGVVSRVEMRVNDEGQFSTAVVAIGAQPRRVWARATVDLDNPRRARVCGWSRGRFFANGTTAAIAAGPDGTSFFGQGWEAAEPVPGQPTARRMTSPDAEVLVPLAAPGSIRIQLDARAPVTAAGGRIELVVNGRGIGARQVSSAWRTFEWTTPSDVWKAGFNRLSIRGSGLLIGDLSLELVVPRSVEPHRR
jgi:hypothetical protein